jgi:threonine aldolase
MALKYSFLNDYSEGAHPDVLKALVKANEGQQAGYGKDDYSLKATDLIKYKIEKPEAAVHLVSGGTQANLIVLDSLLKPYESVIAAITSHINVHETGAIESTEHKINTLESSGGKIKPEEILKVIKKLSPYF